MIFLNFLFGPFATWAPIIFIGLVWLILALRGFSADGRIKMALKIDFSVLERIFTDKRLIYSVIIAGFIFSMFLTGAQYYVWSLSAVGRFFLPPAQPSYFVNYAFIHFWLGHIIGLLLSLVVFGLFCLVRHYRRSVISRSELNKIFLICLLVGWPRLVFLVPLFLLITALVLIVKTFILRGKRLREEKADIFWPLILAALVVLIFGTYLIRIFNLSALVV